jgi:hypothetical protein
MRPSPRVEPYHSQTAEDVESRSMRTLLLNETGSLLAMGHSALARVCPRIHPVCIATLRITGWRFFAMPNDIELGAATLKTAITTVHVCQFALFLWPAPTLYSVGGLGTVHLAGCNFGVAIGGPLQSAITVPMTPVWTAAAGRICVGMET